jgi:GNAT superfamily N-acetyltransferase
LTPDALAELCEVAMPHERLLAAELEHLCFGAGDEIVGDERGTAVLQTRRFGETVAAWLVLVAVHPAEQHKGRGAALVRAVADRAHAHGAREVLLANAVPRYVWPGVDLGNTRAGMLLESCGFERSGLALNMTIPTAFARAAPPDITIERETGDGAREFARRAYPHWVPELERAVALGNAFAARADGGRTIGFGCHSVNRAGWIGPMATDPGAQTRGVGSAVLGAITGDLRARGHSTGEIAWVSNQRFYGKCGATVSRAFMGGRLSL